MIRSIRDEISSWYMQVILLILVLSFITFYGWSGSGLGAGDVVSVDGEKLDVKDFQFQYQNQLQYFQNIGMDLNSEQESMIQARVIESFIQTSLARKQANKIGFVPSDAQVRESITEAFSDAEGNFNYEYYQNFVRNRMGKTPSVFEQEEARRLNAANYQIWLSQTGLASPLSIRQDFQINNHLRSIDYVKVTPESISHKLTIDKRITDEDIASYYESNASDFLTQPKRNLDILMVTKNERENPQAFFERGNKMLSLIEKDASQPFANFAKEDESLVFIDTGLIDYDTSIDSIGKQNLSTLLNATLSLNPGEISQVISSRDGSQMFLVKLKGKVDPQPIPIDDVQEDIKANILQARRDDAFESFVQSVFDAWIASEESLQSLSNKFSSLIETTELFTFNAQGAVADLGNDPELMNDVFSQTSQEGVKLPKLYRFEDGFLVGQISEVQTPNMNQFEENQKSIWSVSSDQVGNQNLEVILERARQKADIKQAAGVGQI